MNIRLVNVYLLNVPSVSSPYFNKIKRTSHLGKWHALSLEILLVFVACLRCLRSFQADMKQLHGTEIDMDTDTEFTAASFECFGKHTLIIGKLYRPQNGEAQQAYAEEICSNIRSLYQSHPISTIWIAGDANLPDIDWEKNTVNGHSNPSSLNQLF